jgi:hypothetical protein
MSCSSRPFLSDGPREPVDGEIVGGESQPGRAGEAEPWVLELRDLRLPGQAQLGEPPDGGRGPAVLEAIYEQTKPLGEWQVSRWGCRTRGRHAGAAVGQPRRSGRSRRRQRSRPGHAR